MTKTPIPNTPPANREHKLSKLAEQRDITVRELIVTAIEEAEGNVPVAARSLDVTPNALNYHLRKRGLRIKKTITVELVSEKS
jgi:transcriptional regulator with GAF, ATPase, and Fis domain